MIVGSRRSKVEVKPADEKKLGNLLEFYVGVKGPASGRRDNTVYLDGAIFASRINRKKLSEDKYKTGLLDVGRHCHSVSHSLTHSIYS